MFLTKISVGGIQEAEGARWRNKVQCAPVAAAERSAGTPYNFQEEPSTTSMQ